MGWVSVVTDLLWVSMSVVWVFQWVGFDGYDFALGFDFSGLGFGGFGFVGGLGFGFSVDKMVEGGGGGDGGVSGGRRKIHR